MLQINYIKCLCKNYVEFVNLLLSFGDWLMDEGIEGRLLNGCTLTIGFDAIVVASISLIFKNSLYV